MEDLIKSKEVRKQKSKNDILENRILKLEEEMDIIKKMLGVFGRKNTQDNSKEIDELKAKIKEQKGQIKSLEKAKDDLNSQLRMRDREIEGLKDEISRQKSEIEGIKRDNKKLKDELEQNPLKRLENIFGSLDSGIQGGVENILYSDNGLNIFAKGVLNIESIWDYLEYLNREHKDSEFEKLKNIFEIIFESYRAVTKMDYLETQPNEEYDMNLHQRDNRSKEYDGNIQKVVLRGIKRGDKIIKRSIVML